MTCFGISQKKNVDFEDYASSLHSGQVGLLITFETIAGALSRVERAIGRHRMALPNYNQNYSTWDVYRTRFCAD